MVLKSVSQWKTHWDSKDGIVNPIEINGYCVNGKSIDNDTYYKAIILPTLDLLELKPHHRVLEVGCGTGLILSEIESIVTKAVGTDLSKTMVGRYDGKAEMLVCGAHELPFTRESFDRILMVGVALYFPDTSYFYNVIQDLLTMLRPNGIILIGDLLLGEQSSKSQYIIYNKHELIDFLDTINVPYSIVCQNKYKRQINSRWDILIFKD